MLAKYFTLRIATTSHLAFEDISSKFCGLAIYTADLEVFYYTQFSIQQRRIMLRKQSLKTHSRSNLTSVRFYGQKPTFRTIFKRRNDTIPVSQLYEDLPTSQSQTQLMTQSQVLVRSEEQPEQQKQLNIRDYVKKMGAKQQIDEDGKQQQCVSRLNIEDQSFRKTARPPLESSRVMAQLRQEETKAKKTIEELSHKIQSFINHNMNLLRVQKRNIGLSKWQETKVSFSIDKQLQQIYSYYAELRIQIDQSQQQSQKLKDLNKKILILQKMMANESVESQCLRLQYYSWKNQRGNTTSFSSKHLLSDAKRINRDTKPLSLNRDQIQKAKQIIPLSSTTKSSFKKPNKDYYLVSKEIKNPYSLNRQPFPRSSYSAQYLNYGYIPTYAYKPDSIRQSPQASLTITPSTYQQEYKQKLAQIKKVNFKELDCFKDKFKNTNISFMKCSKKQGFQPAQNLKKKLKHYSNDENLRELSVPKRSPNASFIRLVNLTPTNGSYRTETQKQFNWHRSLVQKQNEDRIESEIKDQRLLQLKQTFKNLVLK